MSGRATPSRRTLLQVAAVALLMAGYVALGAWLHLAFGTHVVYSHAGYIPIVLACLWWGRKGLVVAGLVASLPLGLRLLGAADVPLWTDLARMFFFCVVAVAVAELREEVVTGERALRASEEKYRLIVEKSLAGIFIYADDTILFANRRIGRMLGRRPEEMTGTPVWKLFAEDDLVRVRELLSPRDDGALADAHCECRLVRADGTRIWADLAGSAAVFEGRPAVLVNAYDVTGRKEAEAKRRELAELMRRQEDQLVHSTRLAELGEMSAAVAHDLNQPLTGIRNFANNAIYMIEEGTGSTEEVKENLRWIAEQVQRAAKIIHQMRDMTRKSERQFAPLDVNQIIRESVEFLMPQMRLTGVQVDLELAGALPCVMGDKTRLEQVFLNLLTNARQAMERSPERRLTVETHAGSGRDPFLVVEVSDTGAGFSAEEAARIFDAFYSTKTQGHGTGLGLTIAQRIIKDHRGTIKAEGQPGKGARFTMRLPFAEAADPEEASPSHA